MEVVNLKKHGLSIESQQKATLKASRKRTSKLLQKAHDLGLAEIYIDYKGRIIRKKDNKD